MTLFRRASALLAAAALTGSPALADHSALQYVPTDCEISILVDPQPIFADASLAPLAKQAAAGAQQSGMPLSLETLSSIGFGVDIPAGTNLMMMGNPSMPQPGTYFAVTSSDTSISNLRDMLGMTMTSSTNPDGKAVFSDGDSTVTFSDDDRTMYGVGGGEKSLAKSLAATQGANVSKKASFNPGSGFVETPILYVHATDIQDLLGQVASFGAMMLMQGGSSPEARQHLSAMQGGLASVGQIKVIEISIGLAGDNVLAGLRLEATDAAAANSLRGFVDGALNLAQAEGNLTAEDRENLKLEVEGSVVMLKSSMPKELLAQGLATTAQAAVSGGGF